MFRFRRRYTGNNRKDRLYQRFYAALAPLVDHWQWSEYVPVQKNLQAQGDLKEFLRRAHMLLPRAKIYNFEPLAVTAGGTEYMRRLLAVKRNLELQRWDNACHELYDVVHFHYIQDRRILYTIIGLLEGYL